MFCSKSGVVFCGNFYADFVVFKFATSNFVNIGEVGEMVNKYCCANVTLCCRYPPGELV